MIWTRLAGLALLPLTPAVAAWALYIFRDSDVPEDHSYLHNLRALARECWNLATTGSVFGKRRRARRCA